MTFPDYSAYLTPERVEVEEKAWTEAEFHKIYGFIVSRLLGDCLPTERRVVELGCGTGWVPGEVEDLDMQYLGIDANPTVLTKAREKNDDRCQFMRQDIRSVSRSWLEANAPWRLPLADVAVSFAVMKHFGLHEVMDRIAGLLKLANRWAAFSIPMAAERKDDGVEYHHSWLTLPDVRKLLDDAGHEWLHALNLQGHFVEPDTVGNEMIILTRVRE